MSLTEKQIKERVSYIGGGDCAAILGLSRWRTALQTWASKTGMIEAKDISQEMPVKMGNLLEDAVCQLFEDDTGKKLETANASACEKRGIKYVPNPDDPEGTVTILHPVHSFIGGNLDKLVKDENAFFEAKTTNSYKQSEWENKDEIPVEYQLQCLHYMIVGGFDHCYIGCLIGNRKFVWRKIERDEKKLATILKREVDFWNNFVIPQVMPAVSADDAVALYNLFPEAAPESVIELGDEASKICEARDSLLADKKVLEREIDECNNQLKAMLKTYEVGMTPMYKVSWKSQITKRIDTERMRKDEPALYEKFLKEVVARVLRVSVKRNT